MITVFRLWIQAVTKLISAETFFISYLVLCETVYQETVIPRIFAILFTFKFGREELTDLLLVSTSDIIFVRILVSVVQNIYRFTGVVIRQP